MKKQFIRYLLFAATVAAVILMLRLVNWIPWIIQKDTIRPYSNIDLVRTTLQIHRVFVPSYFPENLRWPPSRILAQRAPFTAVILEFRDEQTGDTVLMTSQTAGGRPPVWDKKIEVQRVEEQVTYSLKGRKAVLTVGQCADGEPCSGVSWDEGKYRIDVLMKSGPFDLIGIAESMIHGSVPGSEAP